MRQKDSDALRVREVQAREAVLEGLQDVVEALQANMRAIHALTSQKAGEADYVPAPYRPRHALRSLWQVEVPDTHVLETVDREGQTHRILICVCGSQTLLPVKGHVECSGVRWHGENDQEVLAPDGCSRFFRVKAADVQVHRFPYPAQLTAL